jgi:hypothetical protein
MDWPATGFERQMLEDVMAAADPPAPTAWVFVSRDEWESQISAMRRIRASDDAISLAVDPDSNTQDATVLTMRLVGVFIDDHKGKVFMWIFLATIMLVFLVTSVSFACRRGGSAVFMLMEGDEMRKLRISRETRVSRALRGAPLWRLKTKKGRRSGTGYHAVSTLSPSP